MTDALGGEVAPAPHREFGLATIHVEPGAPLFASVPVGPARLGQPRRLRHGGAARLPRSRRRARTRRSPRWPPRIGGSTRCCSIRKSRTPITASRSCATSPTTSAAAPATGRCRRSCEEATDADPRAGRRRPRRLRPERRRRFDRRGGADPPRDRRSADVHLRRQRRDAAGRSGPDPQALRAAAACRSSSWTPRRCSSIGWPASPIRSRSARSSARAFIDVFEAEAQKLGSFDFLGAGHALSGRDRERVGHRPVARDQEPPQRRRPARAHALHARRAAAAAVQGRGAAGRHGARPRRRVRLAPAVPGARARGAHSRRGHAVAPGPRAPRRSHRRRGSEAGGLVPDGCGSRSRCCCRCRASA